ncbi:non-canonical purine NTP pyrophosphatase [uncultured Microbacterium sp.]|uniref:non-canonical purine NTP pyrophosphatase n=1 Tax=uncultured Microbacterium sp. TaxID=191216 RepID=UPI0035C966CB
MTERTVLIATGNVGKVGLLSSLLEEANVGWAVIDPGDAEDHAPLGYEAAVRAKLHAARKKAGDASATILAHDSGFEFEALKGRPGPATKSWLQDGSRWAGIPVGSRVRAVHCVGILCVDGEFVMRDHDDRIVLAASVVPSQSDLPLTDALIGPRAALARLVSRCLALSTGAVA